MRRMKAFVLDASTTGYARALRSSFRFTHWIAALLLGLAGLILVFGPSFDIPVKVAAIPAITAAVIVAGVRYITRHIPQRG